MPGIIARKLQMTQISKDDRLIPVTLLRVPKQIITQIKTQEKDGYEAVVVNVMSDKGTKVLCKRELPFSQACLEDFASKSVDSSPNDATESPEQGPDSDVGSDTPDVHTEADPTPSSDTHISFGVGSELSISICDGVSDVRLTSTSKGKGFTGAMKRWNFKGGPGAHGSKFHRALGSIGSRKPRRTKPGKKMHGRHGNKTVTLASVPVELYDLERRVVAVRGPVPGGRNTYVVLHFS